MNIGMILDNEFTGDMRVENEIYSLRQAGFNVSVLCFNHGNKPEREDFYGAQIRRISISLFKKNKMKGLMLTPFDFYTGYWAKKIVPFVLDNKIDVLHAHDLYMLPAAFRANSLLRKSGHHALLVVGDLHENYPAALSYYKFTHTFPGKYIVSIPKWRKAETEWIHKADHIITVIEEAVERYKKMGLPDKKISVVANYVNPELFVGEGHDDPDIRNKFKRNFVVSYAGGFDVHRGLETAIRSLPLICDSIPEMKLVLIGAGRNLNDLRALATQLNVANMVSFEGWQPHQKLPAYILASDVCLIPHLKTEHTDNTIPHKLFHYMLLKKPVISSDCAPIKRILDDSKAGFIYQSGNEKELAEKIIYAHDHPKLLIEMGQRGRKAVLEKYNWENTAKTLIGLYQNFAKNT